MQLSLLYIFLIFLIGFVIYQINSNNPTDYLQEFVVIFLLICVIPVIYLHAEYYRYNGGKTLTINVVDKRLSFISKSDKKTYHFNDLNKIVSYMAPSFHRGSKLRLLPFEEYHYAKICTNDGQEIIITCLMIRNVQDLTNLIRGIKIEKKVRFFASIALEKFLN